MRKVRYRPPFIVLGYVEKRSERRRKSVDAKICVQKQRADIRGRHEVLHIALGAGNDFKFVLEFVIDGLKLLVDRLQLFLTRLEFLGSGPIFLVDRLEFFIGGA